MASVITLLILIISLITFLIPSTRALNTDGVLLLSFKYSILTDPNSALQSWNPNDADPCSWNGVRCGAPGDSSGQAYARVTELSLPSFRLTGLIPSELALIEFLQVLDLSNNSLNGSLPSTFANATRLRFLDLSNNSLTGRLPDPLPNLQFLNLSDNALAGTLPALQNLTVVSLGSNRFTGDIPSQLNAVEVLDLSANLFNGSLPSDFNAGKLRYLNLSSNSISGPIPQEFARDIPVNATVDLSYNNLTGQVPASPVLLNQTASSFAGNTDLCGDPTHNLCPIPSSAATLPSGSPTSSPAIAAIPKTDDLSPTAAQSGKRKSTTALRTGTVIGIVVGDVAGVLVIGLVVFYIYNIIKKRRKSPCRQSQNGTAAKSAGPIVAAKDDWTSTSSTSPDSRGGFSRWSCLRKGNHNDDDESSSTSTETDPPDDPTKSLEAGGGGGTATGGTLVTVDGAKELELETLLKASAYILGATGSSIMYKAVLEDGTAFAVRRIGESHVERFRDFENQIRVVSKLAHPNLVRIRGFYWGVDEKLIIYDFVPNGSLANARYRKAGTSPCPLPWEARLRIAKGVASGLAFLHEKRHVHGNLKPSNILLGSDMEPRIGDFGLERLVAGDTSYKGGSARTFGSKRSTVSRDSFPDLGLGPSPSPSPSSMGGLSPYFAPESLRSLKPNPKWDVYSFGVILLELLTGKVIVVDEMGQGSNGLTVEDKNRALRMADVAIRSDVEGKEDALLACFKLGYGCASPLPQKRPSMKEAMQILEKFPSSNATYLYGHQL